MKGHSMGLVDWKKSLTRGDRKVVVDTDDLALLLEIVYDHAMSIQDSEPAYALDLKIIVGGLQDDMSTKRSFLIAALREFFFLPTDYPKISASILFVGMVVLLMSFAMAMA